MAANAIELFYLFFQGILVFQSLVFGFLYFTSKRKELLYYFLFLLFAAIYFFVNAPYTFFGIPEQQVWDSTWYDVLNIPIIITENIFYLLFIRAFFRDVTTDNKVHKVLMFTLWSIPVLLLLFAGSRLLHVNDEYVFYAVNSLAVIPSSMAAIVLIKRRPPFAMPVAFGLICTITGTLLTVLMLVLGNRGVNSTFTTHYPLFFIRVGLLGDMIFYLFAILRKWHFQEKRLELEKLESQLAMSELRNKLSSELHDDLGSTLSGVAMYCHLLTDQIGKGHAESAVSSAQVIQRSVDLANRTLGEMVWSINPSEDNFEHLLEKIKEFARDMSHTKGMELRLNIPVKPLTHELSGEYRHHIYLFCKEAINNAVKHSGASRLEVNFTQNLVEDTFEISDNGCGFEPDELKRENGLRNLAFRAKELGGRFLVDTARGNGVRIILKLQKSPNGGYGN
jgi:signal transduction histidine kinase